MKFLKYLLIIASIVVLSPLYSGNAFAQSATPSASPVSSTRPLIPLPSINIDIPLPSISLAASPSPSSTVAPIASVTPSPSASPTSTSSPTPTPTIMTGGLVSSSMPSPTSTPTPSLTPQTSPKILAVTAINSPAPVAAAVRSVQKKLNTVIKSPIDTAAKVLNFNPYTSSAPSRTTSTILLVIAVSCLVSGLVLTNSLNLENLKLKVKEKFDLVRNKVRLHI